MQRYRVDEWEVKDTEKTKRRHNDKLKFWSRQRGLTIKWGLWDDDGDDDDADDDDDDDNDVDIDDDSDDKVDGDDDNVNNKTNDWGND